MSAAGTRGEQIIGILKEHQVGLAAKDLYRKHGINEADFNNGVWKYGGMEASDVRKLKPLKGENHKLKKLLAEPVPDVATLKEMLEKNS